MCKWSTDFLLLVSVYMQCSSSYNVGVVQSSKKWWNCPPTGGQFFVLLGCWWLHFAFKSIQDFYKIQNIPLMFCSNVKILEVCLLSQVLVSSYPRWCGHVSCNTEGRSQGSTITVWMATWLGALRADHWKYFSLISWSLCHCSTCLHWMWLRTMQWVGSFHDHI